MSLCASIYMCFVVTCWERADLLALVCGVYCDPNRQADIRALESVQCHAARYVNNDYTTRTSGCGIVMVKVLGWESSEDRRYVARHSLLYKIIQNGRVDINAATYLVQWNRCTRKQSAYFQERINNEIDFHPFFPRTIREWNAEPSNGKGQLFHIRCAHIPQDQLRSFSVPGPITGRRSSKG